MFIRRSRPTPTRSRRLKGEDAKLLAETMRDYRRAGLDLPKAQRDEVERMRKELTRPDHGFRVQRHQGARRR